MSIRRSDAGGGFGVRGELYPEDLLVPYLARALGRPVKWIEDRAEHLVATNHSREQLHRLEAAFDDEHRLLALRDELWHDNGAYLRTHGVVVPELTLSMLPGPYRVPAYEGTAHVALTNKTPCGTYRAPGRFEGTFARERLLDAAAGELGIDRLELRRRNLLRPDELPHERPLPVLGHDVVIDVGDFPDLLDRAVEAAGFEAWQAEAEDARRDGRPWAAGSACSWRRAAAGPTRPRASASWRAARCWWTPARRRSARVSRPCSPRSPPTCSASHPETVSVVAGDTDMVGDGVGSWASRSTVMAGGAAHHAAEATAEQAGRWRRSCSRRAPRTSCCATGASRSPARRAAASRSARSPRPATRSAARAAARSPGSARPRLRGRADDLPVRRAPRAGRGRPRHGRRRRPALLRRLRGRPGGPAPARRGPARRRRRAGHRRRAAGGVPLRRLGPAARGLVHGLPAADRRGDAGVGTLSARTRRRPATRWAPRAPARAA